MRVSYVAHACVPIFNAMIRANLFTLMLRVELRYAFIAVKVFIATYSSISIKLGYIYVHSYLYSPRN